MTGVDCVPPSGPGQTSLAATDEVADSEKPGVGRGVGDGVTMAQFGVVQHRPRSSSHVASRSSHLDVRGAADAEMSVMRKLEKMTPSSAYVKRPTWPPPRDAYERRGGYYADDAGPPRGGDYRDRRGPPREHERAPPEYYDRPPPRSRPPPPGRIFIYGLPDDIREPELEDLYYRCGRIEYIEIRRSSRSGRVEGVVVFEDFRDADYAKRETDGIRFERERITVELDDRF
mmetsp:Transcript_20019/g.79837  ORF Transcript_20019/g.79837 Transcript_20019/m.79837 type:complete len:230 (-) Transcript_20019:917-1606(-)